MNDTKLGLVALLLLNPIVLVILVVVSVVGMIVVAIGIGAIIYYGLTTGIVLFAISGLAIVFLHYAKIMDLQKQPILIAVPPIMFGVGYVTQRLRIFSITPVTMQSSSASAVLSPSATLIAQIVIVALIIVVAYMVIVKARR